MDREPFVYLLMDRQAFSASQGDALLRLLQRGLRSPWLHLSSEGSLK